jgi:hypothetical protein
MAVANDSKCSMMLRHKIQIFMYNTFCEKCFYILIEWNLGVMSDGSQNICYQLLSTKFIDEVTNIAVSVW